MALTRFRRRAPEPVPFVAQTIQWLSRSHANVKLHNGSAGSMWINANWNLPHRRR